MKTRLAALAAIIAVVAAIAGAGTAAAHGPHTCQPHYVWNPYHGCIPNP